MVQTYLPGERRTRVRRESLGSQVADQLRHDILVGRLVPGTTLSQQQVCEDFGTSRMPVRDALRQLTHEGLIVSNNNGHAQVVGMTSADIWDTYSAEALLVGRASRRAAQIITDEELDTLASIYERIKETDEEGSPEVIAELNWQFHRHINLCSRSAKLLALIRAVSMSIPRRFQVEIPEWSVHANEHHSEILELMRAHDADGVEKATHQHVLDASLQFIKYLETRAPHDG